MYKKRSGTSGISGQLYETKLISLILFRLQHNENVEEFSLASNMDEIGAFDDICLKIKMKGHSKTKLIFIQAKHKDNDDKFLTLDNKNDLVKWSDSFMKIKQKFRTCKCQDDLFSGRFDKTECLFVLYTNAKYGADTDNTFIHSFSEDLNKLIATSPNVGSQPVYTEKDVQEFSVKILKEEISMLAENLIKYLNDNVNQSMNIMNDEYISPYHVILVKKIMNISEIQYDKQNPNLKWRLLTFRENFFKTNDEHIVLFRNHLYEQMFKNQSKLRNSDIGEKTVMTLVTEFLSKPSAASLWPLIGTHIAYNKNGRLEFVNKRAAGELYRLENNIPPSMLNEAMTIAAVNILGTLKIKVPVTFGNVDIAIRSSKRLDILVDLIVNICKQFNQIQSHKIVTIDEAVDNRILKGNGGLGSGVGNILTYDDDTKLLKFADKFTPEQINAQNLYLKLKTKINDIHMYRFDVKSVQFPKLSFDCSEEAKEFLSRLVIYAKQSNHHEVEEILKKEIELHHSSNLHKHSMKTDSLFLYFHNEIQKWWMSPKKGPYLSKANDLYEQAIKNNVLEPQISALQNSFYIKNIKYLGYNFEEIALESINSVNVLSNSIIVSNIIALTTNKVIQYLKNNNNHNHAVLNVECVLNLPKEELRALNEELRNTERVIIVIFENIKHSRTLYKVLDDVAQATEDKHVIAITNNALLETLQDYFVKSEVINDETQSLNDLTLESRTAILNNAQVIFQGQEVNLDQLIHDVSVNFINGAVLDKIIRKETILLGESLSNASYEDVKHLYIERKVKRNLFSSEDDDHVHMLQSFYDIDDNTVLITAAPGMGKSTLLTHLSLKTKELVQKLWIVRINLLDYSKEFFKWQENKTAFDTLETLKFLCQVILKKYNLNISLKEIDGKVYLEDCAGDEWTSFELNVFLHCYNNKRLFLLFDGFDEICPHYKDNVLKFFEVIRNYPQQNKMWVTSRPYSEILPDLQRVLGKSYEIECIEDTEQEKYVKKFWSEKLIFDKLNRNQIENAVSIIKRFSRGIMSDGICLWKIFLYFYDYFKPYLYGIVPVKESHYNEKVSQIDSIMGTPLLLYLIADYFVNITIANKNTNKTGMDINILTIYDMFIETKLKKILYEDKNKMDVFNPDIISRYEKDRTECLAMHKKVAAYTILFNEIWLEEFEDISPFYKDANELKDLIYNIKSGTEKTGLISHVTPDNIPVFIHRTFTEFFTAEYICDIFKNVQIKFETQKILLVTLKLYRNNDIMPWINKKKEIDEELNCIIENLENELPFQSEWFAEMFSHEVWTREQYIRLVNSNTNDYELGSENRCRSICFLGKFMKKDVVLMKPHLNKYFKDVEENI